MLYVIFLLLGVAFGIRILYLQYLSDEVAVNADRIHPRIFRMKSVRGHRGKILSRDGEPLATSLLRYQVQMDFGSEGFDSLELFHRHSDSLAKLLSAYFGDRSVAEYRRLFREERTRCYQLRYRKDSAVMRSEGLFSRLIDVIRGEPTMNIKLYDTIRDHTPFELLPRWVDYAEWQTLRRYPILNWNLGMTYRLVDSAERIYPNRGVARRTIGAINNDRGSDYGIDGVYDNILKGVDGEVMLKKIASGFSGQVPGVQNRDAVDGMDVVTTIDLDIQNIIHTSLLKQCQAQRAIWGTSIVMEVETGDILAISNLDRRADGSYAEGQNRAIGARAEPGSTFKLLSTMALLEVAKMPTSKIYDSENGARVKVGNAWVRDSHKDGHETDLRTAFTRSQNVYFAKAIYEHFREDPKLYTNFLRTLYLDRTMGLEAFGEQPPRLNEQGTKGWTPHMTLVNMGYGYGVELSPIQTLTIYNAVANGGKMVAPRLVSEIRRDGRKVERFPTKVLVDEICSRPTLDTLRSFLKGVCGKDGTGYWYLGRFDGLEVAAKTGTAQFAQSGGRHSDGIYLGSMVAYFPADNPKYSIFTMLQIRQGESKSIYGAGLAGPVMREAIQQIYNQEVGWHTRLDTASVSRPRNIKHGNITSIERVAKSLDGSKLRGCVNHIVDSDGWGRVQYDSLGRVTTTPLEIDPTIMPNLYGMGLRDALYLAESVGLKVKVENTGSVWRQSIKAGTKIRKGDKLTLQLRQ